MARFSNKEVVAVAASRCNAAVYVRQLAFVLVVLTRTNSQTLLCIVVDDRANSSFVLNSSWHEDMADNASIRTMRLVNSRVDVSAMHASMMLASNARNKLTCNCGYCDQLMLFQVSVILLTAKIGRDNKKISRRELASARSSNASRQRWYCVTTSKERFFAPAIVA